MSKKYIITTIQEVKRTYIRDDCDGEYTMKECQENFESENFNGTELDVEYDDETVIKIKEQRKRGTSEKLFSKI
mgnify:CR=1 FL=1